MKQWHHNLSNWTINKELILSHIYHLQEERCNSNFLRILPFGPKLGREWGNSQSTIKKTEMWAIFYDSLFLCHQNVQYYPFPSKTFILCHIFLGKTFRKRASIWPLKCIWNEIFDSDYIGPFESAFKDKTITVYRLLITGLDPKL